MIRKRRRIAKSKITSKVGKVGVQNQIIHW
jgi:hypothetical protein